MALQSLFSCLFFCLSHLLYTSYAYIYVFIYKRPYRVLSLSTIRNDAHNQVSLFTSCHSLCAQEEESQSPMTENKRERENRTLLADEKNDDKRGEKQSNQLSFLLPCSPPCVFTYAAVFLFTPTSLFFLYSLALIIIILRLLLSSSRYTSPTLICVYSSVFVLCRRFSVRAGSMFASR